MVDSYNAALQFRDSLAKDPDKSAGHVEQKAAYLLLESGFNDAQKRDFYQSLAKVDSQFKVQYGFGEMKVSYTGPDGKTANFGQETEDKLADLKQEKENQRQRGEAAREHVLKSEQKGGLLDQIGKGLNTLNPLGTWDNSEYENPFGEGGKR